MRTEGKLGTCIVSDSSSRCSECEGSGDSEILHFLYVNVDVGGMWGGCACHAGVWRSKTTSGVVS